MKKIAVKKTPTKRPAKIGKTSEPVKKHHLGHTPKSNKNKTDYGVK